MDFNDSPTEAAFRQQARQWIAANRHRVGALGDSEQSHMAAAMRWQAIKAEGGWACLDWPAEHGGRGASAIEGAIFSQEEATAGCGDLAGAYVITLGMAAPTILAHANAEQKQRLLPGIVNGSHLWCQLFSEPAAGSDLAGIRTRAERRDGHWLVNGQKIWTSLAQHSQWAILLTRSEPELPKHKGLTYFVVDMRSPGIEVRPIKQASGQSEFNEVFLTDVVIPDSNRLGAINDGWRVAMTTLMSERLSVGTAFPTNVREVMEVARQTPMGDGSALDDGAVQDRIADWIVRASGLEATKFRILTALSQGRAPGPEASITKLVLGEGRQNIASFALDILGLAGIPSGSDAAGWGHHDFFRAIGNRLEGGTDEVLRNVIGERVLGLPPEPRVDKDRPFSRS